jgi:hypothetical protein
MKVRKGGSKIQSIFFFLCFPSLGDSLVTATASTADLVDDEHETVLAEGGEIRPELIVGDALLDALVSADELQEDEASQEVDDEEDGQSDEQDGASRETASAAGGFVRHKDLVDVGRLRAEGGRDDGEVGSGFGLRIADHGDHGSTWRVSGGSDIKLDGSLGETSIVNSDRLGRVGSEGIEGRLGSLLASGSSGLSAWNIDANTELISPLTNLINYAERLDGRSLGELVQVDGALFAIRCDRCELVANALGRGGLHSNVRNRQNRQQEESGGASHS